MKKIFSYIALGTAALCAFSLTSCGSATNESSYEGFTYTVKDGKATITGYDDTTTDLVIPSTVEDMWDTYEVTAIANYAFFYSDKIQKVVIPSSVKEIGHGAFFGCYRLVDVYNLSDVELKVGKTSNGYTAYYAYDVHTSLDEQSFITNVDGFNFVKDEKGNNLLLSYTGSDTNITLPETYNGENYAIRDFAFFENDNLEEVVIPNTVSSLGQYAFYSCDSLKEITLSNTIVSIQDYTFFGCANLNNVDIPNSVTRIGKGAFSGCKSFTKIVIPENVTALLKESFGNCTSVTVLVVLSKTVATSGYPFKYCQFQYVYFNGNADDWSVIRIDKETQAQLNPATNPIYLFSETQPTKDGNFWNYDEEGNIVIWPKAAAVAE